MFFVTGDPVPVRNKPRFALVFLLHMYLEKPFLLLFIGPCQTDVQVSFGFPNPIPACLGILLILFLDDIILHPHLTPFLLHMDKILTPLILAHKTQGKVWKSLLQSNRPSVTCCGQVAEKELFVEQNVYKKGKRWNKMPE